MKLRDLKKLAADHIRNRWTTADPAWLKQAIKNLKYVREQKIVECENECNECHIFSTHFLYKDPNYVSKRNDTKIKITVQMTMKDI